jgi:hypothetical protein
MSPNIHVFDGKMESYCACGCGQKIELKPHHKYYGIPRFISGHNLTPHPKPKIEKICPNCGKTFKVPPSLSRRVFCSRKCAREHSWKSIMPPKEKLEALYLREKKTLEQLASMFGVSCTPVYKWLRYYGIPIRRGCGRSANIYRNYKPSALVKGDVSDFDLGYICGIIDGEGSIGITQQKRKDEGITLRPYVQIVNTDYEAIKFLQSELGGDIQIHVSKNSKEKDTYHLRIMNTQLVLNTLRKILSGLKIKREQAILVIEFCESRLKGAIERGLGYTEQELEIFHKVKELNKRGK